jgi:hypothetical protein
VNLWMKRAIGAAALGGSLLALGAGAASAQEVSADASARLGRPTSAEVRVCADGRVLSRLVGSCSGQATSGTVNAGRDRDGSRARARVPRLASADVSLGTRRTRPRATAAAQASVTPRSGSATADTSADTGPIASGNQVDAGIGSISPSFPVTVCGNAVGALGDASVSCGADTSSGGIIAPPPGTTPSGSTDTDGTTGSPGSTGTSGIPGTTGLTPDAGDPITTSAPLRPVVSASGALPFTGTAGDLLTLAAGGLLAAGVLVVRATRPATAATKRGDDR